jgi:hydrogenase maturation protein HypF
MKEDALDTTEMLLKIFENRGSYSKADLAYSAHAYLAKGLALIATEKAQEDGIRNIGFSGGIACNQILVSIMRNTVENAGFQFLVNKAIPPGDGGLSFGQAVAVGFSES